MKKIRISAALLAAVLIAGTCGGDKSPWLYKIEGKALTLKQLDEAYSGFSIIAKDQLQGLMRRILTDEDLKQILEDPDRVGNPELARQLRSAGKDAFSEQYKDMLILNMEAQKEGFAKRADVKAKLDFLQKYYIMQLYVTDQIKVSEIKFSDAEAMAVWEKVKKTRPDLKTVPLDQGLEMAKGQMMMGAIAEKQQMIMKTTKEKYRIETNKDFDIAAHVKNEREEARKKREQASTNPGTTPPAPAPVTPPKK